MYSLNFAATKMYFLIACLKELSNLGAKKRRPDDDDEAADEGIGIL